ncbi:stage V sporulation protein AC, partial [Cohnella sp. CBP 2801]|nr:stage V sporulation protein AC [Cohnella zeiphila]
MATKEAQRGRTAYKPLSMSPKEYKAFAKNREPSRSVFRNCVLAFLVGGVICLIGEGVQRFFMAAF